MLEAFNLTAKIMRKCLDNFKDFKTERDVVKFLREEVMKRKLKVAFRPLIVSGNNYLEIHHKSNNTKLRGFVIVDFGVKYKGYCGDMTRTVYIGKPSKGDLELYDYVLTAYNIALENLQIGIKCSELDLIVRSALCKYRKNFKHALGHGIGRKVHQFPVICPRDNRKIKKGKIFTIEPGLYFKSKGVRIEDSVLIGERNKILTKGSRDLVVIN